MTVVPLDPLRDVEIQIEDLERRLDRRGFFSLLLAAGLAAPPSMGGGQREFLAGVAARLIPRQAVLQTGIDPVANIEHMLAQGSGLRRRKILRLLSWSRRISFLYGGEQIALRAARSRFALIRKLAKALSSLCLVAFWGDERALVLIDPPGERP